MKKLLTVLSTILLTVMSVSTAYAASVPPQLFPGNDSNPSDYTPPPGYIHYEIPNSGNEGTHIVTLNSSGAVDPNGPYIFTVLVGTEAGESYTKVLAWSSNFPVYAVIVKGGDAFNLYQYDSSVRNDTDLVSPDNASGMPADVSHVSIVYNPTDFPPVTPPPCTPCPPSTPCPPCTPCPPLLSCIINFVYFIVLFGLLLFIAMIVFLSNCRINKPHGKKSCKGKDCKEDEKDIDIDIDIDNDLDNNLDNKNDNDINNKNDNDINNKNDNENYNDNYNDNYNKNNNDIYNKNYNDNYNKNNIINKTKFDFEKNIYIDDPCDDCHDKNRPDHGCK